MRDRDLEMDSRSGWIEIHKAMVNVRVYRQLILLQGQLGMVRGNNAISSEQREKEYVLAVAQLRAQLDRLNDDPLIIALAEFLDKNRLTAQWRAESLRLPSTPLSIRSRSKPVRLNEDLLTIYRNLRRAA